MPLLVFRGAPLRAALLQATGGARLYRHVLWVEGFYISAFALWIGVKSSETDSLVRSWSVEATSEVAKAEVRHAVKMFFAFSVPRPKP